MRIADSSGLVCADCSFVKYDSCDLEKALSVLDNAPWEAQLKLFEELDESRPNDTPCWPDLSFRVGAHHISYMKDPDGIRFTVEVCTPRPKKILGILKLAKFFEFKKVGHHMAKEYLKIFFTLEPLEQYEYFKSQRG